MTDKIREVDILSAIEVYHKDYFSLQGALENSNKIVLLYGPKDCGKKYALTQFCRVNLKVPYFCANLKTEEDILGKMVDGKYQKSQLFMAYINGEVLIVENAANAQLLTLLVKIQNSKSINFPCGKTLKGKGFKIVCISDEEEVNLEGLEGIMAVKFDYDPAIEAIICKDHDLYSFLNAVRKSKTLGVTTYTFKKLYDMSKIPSFTKADIVKSLLYKTSLDAVKQILKAGKELKNNAYMKELLSLYKVY